MIDWQGRLSGAGNAAAQMVLVRFTGPGLEIKTADARRYLWPYAQIKSSAPLYPGAEVLVFSASEPDARLLVKHPDFAAQLLEFTPHLSRSTARKRLLVPMFAVTAVIVLAGAYIGLSETRYSLLIARMIPQPTWNSLGEQIVRSISGGHKTCRSRPGVKALNTLVSRLNRGQNKRNFKVRVVDLNVINAFATPGENIVISNKLIQFVKSPDEVAGVLAHEMGHGLENHPEAGLVRALGISAAMSILLGGSSDNIASIGSMLLQMSYSRKAEREADSHALDLLKAAAIAPQPLADFFRRFEKKMNAETGKLARTALSLIGSHPATQERVKTIESTPAWPSRPALGPQDWQALKHICDQGETRRF